MPTPLPVISGTYLVTQHLTPGAARHAFVNRMCIFTSTSPVTTSAIATKFAAQYAAHIMPIISSDIVMGDTDVLPLDGTTSTVSYTTASAGTAGGASAGTDLPNAVCFVLAWQTGTRGRSHRGRSYIPGVRTGALVDIRTNDVNTGSIATITAAGNGFITGLPAGAAPVLILSVLSRKLSVATAVVNCRGDAKLGIQRRRYEVVARH